MKTIINNVKNKFIWFDMDGTLVDFFGDSKWLEKIQNEDISVFEQPKPLINIRDFKNCCKKLKEKGYKIGIISYLPWESSLEYKKAVKKAKQIYINKHFKNIKFDNIHICIKDIPKDLFANEGDVLFDDDPEFRKTWSKGKAYTHENIVNKLKKIYKLD